MAKLRRGVYGRLSAGKEYSTSDNFDLVMDEARQRWRVDNWRAKPENFDISRRELEEDAPQAVKLDPDRMKLDIKHDLMGDDLSLKALRSLDYSASYRPRGRIDERITGPYTNPRKYEVLAGVTQAPPEDLSFLSDAQRRREREGERSGKLRVSSKRLETSVDERRKKLNSMLPDDAPETDAIIKEAQARRAKEDREIGRKTGQREKKRRFPGEVMYDDYLADYYETHAGRLSNLPRQDGMEKSTQQLPPFYSETRHWSRIDDPDPAWSEVMRNTDIVIPEGFEGEDGSAGARYVSDSDYDPLDPYQEVEGMEPRALRRADREPRTLDSETLALSGVDPKRVEEIMHHKYRGRWLPPEFFYDDELVAEYYNLSGRGAIGNEDFISWARRQRAEAEYREEAEARAEAEMERARRLHRARPASPGRRYYSDGEYIPVPERQFDPEEYERARQLGYQTGREYAEAQRAMEDERRLEKERRQREAQRKAEERKRRQYEEQKELYEQGRKQYEQQLERQKKRYEEQFESQRKQYERQQKRQYEEYKKRTAASGGAKPGKKGKSGSADGYSGMYPDLFESYGQYNPYNHFAGDDAPKKKKKNA